MIIDTNFIIFNIHLKSLNASALAFILIGCVLLYHLGASISGKIPSNLLRSINFCRIDWTLAAVDIVPVAGEKELCTCVRVGTIWATGAFSMAALSSARWFFDLGSNYQNG